MGKVIAESNIVLLSSSLLFATKWYPIILCPLVSSKEGTGKDFSWRKIRFVRVYVIYNSSNMASHIREIEVYGK